MEMGKACRVAFPIAHRIESNHRSTPSPLAAVDRADSPKCCNDPLSRQPICAG